MSFSNEIKNIRKASLLSQKEFAQELGVSFATVNRWETGKTMPTYKCLRMLKLFCEGRGIEFDKSISKEAI